MLSNEDDPSSVLLLENDLWLLSFDEIRKANVAHVAHVANVAHVTGLAGLASRVDFWLFA